MRASETKRSFFGTFSMTSNFSFIILDDKEIKGEQHVEKILNSRQKTKKKLLIFSLDRCCCLSHSLLLTKTSVDGKRIGTITTTSSSKEDLKSLKVPVRRFSCFQLNLIFNWIQILCAKTAALRKISPASEKI